MLLNVLYKHNLLEELGYTLAKRKQTRGLHTWEPYTLKISSLPINN